MNNLEMLKPSKRKRQKRRDKRMDEELIECYRSKYWKSSKEKGYDKRKVGLGFQYAAQKERMKLRGGGTHSQTDNLKPLIRYLQSKEGKYWNKVYSELSQKMDSNSLLGQHLRDHLMDFVSTQVFIDSGRIMTMGRWGGIYELISGFYPKFYVHPISGVLLKVKKKHQRYIFNR